eukprot:TRINITY_DN7632_c0_g1_i2.p1 TRINITY_DN7632_c0_g1~~TRINITY_DN7632_c0_g1_i2.p1  ORF type:complete len:599 (+),score=145.83 TRINITY_DN7632_c0_g1_i2:596-2392(+)
MRQDQEQGRQLELRVNAMSLRNERVMQKSELLRQRLLELEPDPRFDDVRTALVRDVDSLLSERDSSACGSRQERPRGSNDSESWRKRSEALTTDAEELRRTREECTSARAEIDKLKKDNAQLHLEVDGLRQERDVANAQAEAAASARKAVERSLDSEGRLKAVMTRRTATAGDLEEAILSVESLVEEARRELRASRLRERRAAYEMLLSAISKEDEEDLEKAIAASVLAQVDTEDILKGECKLLELRALTPEQRADKARRQLVTKLKKDAYLYVKRDNEEQLQACLESLPEEVRWQDFRDYAGRSLWKCAQDMRVMRVQKYLAQKLGIEIPEGSGAAPRLAKRQSSHVKDLLGLSRQTSDGAESVEAGTPVVSPKSGHPISLAHAQESGDVPADHGQGVAAENLKVQAAGATPPAVASNASPQKAVKSPEKSAASLPKAMPSTPSRGQEFGNMRVLSSRSPVVLNGNESHDELKAKAMRAVAQDDVEALEAMLKTVPVEVWSKWMNKASKDLVTLSQERGSAEAYCMLARELGIIKDMSRDTFEEGETIWVFEPGEVMAKRASVLEDTPEEAEDVLVEYWDGDEPPLRVERCLIMKMG